jgi:hypothetical protein
MRIRDIFGMIFLGSAVTIQSASYKFFGMSWDYPINAYWLSIPCTCIGLYLIYAESRDKKIRDGLLESDGDWGDSHYSSGSHFTDDIDHSGIDFDD